MLVFLLTLLTAPEPRQSRPRLRDVDRETVLKINRRARHRSADYVWPPRRPSPTPTIKEPQEKRPTTGGISRSHQNINEIKDIFENQSNRSESNTLTKLLQRNTRNDETTLKSNKIDGKENIIIDNNNSHPAGSHISTDNNRKIFNSSPTSSLTTTKNEDQKILYKNIHLWPPISSSSQQQYSNLNKKSCSVRRAMKEKNEKDDVEQIIKRHFHIIDKNYDENVSEYENSSNFHDWHGVASMASNEDERVDDFEGKCARGR